MELKDVKVGQRVFVKRESTAKFSDPLADAFGTTMRELAKLMGMNIVDVCKEKDGFYVSTIFKNGNVSLGDKQSDGSISACWGIFAPSDFELADKPKDDEHIDVLDYVLNEILTVLNDLKQICAETTKPQPKTKQQKRGRGRPKGSVNKKYKGE